MPEIPARRIAEIREMHDAGRYQDVIDECRALLFDDPTNEDVLTLLRESNAALESGATPAPSISEPVSLDSDGGGAAPAETPTRGGTLEERLAQEFGGQDEAEPAGSDLSDEDQQRVMSLISEGEAAYAAGNHQQAIDIWSRIYIIDLNDQRAAKLIEKARVALEEEQRKWDEILQEANDLLEAREFAAAEAKFREVLEISPNHAEALDGIERVAQVQQDEKERAAKVVQMMAKAAKLYQAGQTSEAIYSWEKVLELDPANDKAREYVTEARKRSEETLMGSSQFEQVTPARTSQKRSAPVSADAGLIQSAYQAGEAELTPPVAVKSPLPKFLAIAAVAAVIVAATVYFVLTMDRGELEVDFDALAVEQFETPQTPAAPVEDVVPPVLDPTRAEELELEFEENEGYDQARSAFESGDYGEAAMLYRSLLAEFPDNPLLEQQLHRCHYDAGLMALREGDVATAAREFEVALEMEPEDSVAKRNLEAARRYATQTPDDRLLWFARLQRLRK